MIDKLYELLIILEGNAQKHRKIVNELNYSEGDRLDDRKYHDGMADMANVAKIAVYELFRSELKADLKEKEQNRTVKPDDLIDNIDDGVDLDNHED